MTTAAATSGRATDAAPGGITVTAIGELYFFRVTLALVMLFGLGRRVQRDAAHPTVERVDEYLSGCRRAVGSSIPGVPAVRRQRVVGLPFQALGMKSEKRPPEAGPKLMTVETRTRCPAVVPLLRVTGSKVRQGVVATTV